MELSINMKTDLDFELDGAYEKQKDLGEKSLSFEYYQKLTKEFPPLSYEEECDLACLMQEGDKKAREILINSNIGKVLTIAKRYTNQGLHLDDLIQEGIKGLIHGIEKYDYTKGYRLMTYAGRWVIQSIVRAIDDNGRLIRIPTNKIEKKRRIEKEYSRYIKLMYREPTVEEIAWQMDTEKEVIEKALKICDDAILFCDITDKEAYINMIDHEIPSPFENAVKKTLYHILVNLLLTLTPREAKIICMRFGMDDGIPKTLGDVGMNFNIPRERVRQIEAKALRKLRHPSRSKKIKDFLDISDDNVGYCVKCEEYSTPQKTYISDIIRRHRLRGYYIIEEQELSNKLIKELRSLGYQVLEQFENEDFESLKYLNNTEKIELILYLDKKGVRMKDCPNDVYPNVYNHIEDKIKKKEQDYMIKDYNWDINNFLCLCSVGKETKVLIDKPFLSIITNMPIKVIDNKLRFNVNIVALSISYCMKNVELESITLTDTNGYESGEWRYEIPTEEDVNTDTQKYISISFPLTTIYRVKNMKYLTICYKDKVTNRRFTFVYEIMFDDEIV